MGEDEEGRGGRGDGGAAMAPCSVLEAPRVRLCSPEKDPREPVKRSLAEGKAKQMHSAGA